MEENKKIILVSACLIGDNCKYSGGNNLSETVLKYIEGATVIPFCPEVAGGLPVPRLPCEIKDGVVINSAGKSVDEEFRTGARIGVELAIEKGVTLAILQPRSPSCGVNRVYNGNFEGKLVSGSGVFAKALSEAGICVREPEDLTTEH